MVLNQENDTHCWCGTRFSDPGIWGWRWCSVHGYQDRASDPIYLPGDGEMMAARGAIVSTLQSIANGNLTLTADMMDQIIKAVVVSLRWQPSHLM